MISIIMIVYKVEQYLVQSIESVLAQDYKDFELILVVGENGPDNCENICREYAKKDSRIKLVVGEAKGPAVARNQGLELVSGDYLGFVDADDYVEPDMLSSMMRNIEETGADIAVCGRYYEYKNKQLADKATGRVVYTNDEALRVTLSYEGFYLHCWDKLFSKKIYEGLYFNPDVVVEDRIIVDRLISKADKIVYDPAPKYHFRERSGSLSKKSGMVRLNVEANELMEEFILENHPAIADDLNRYMLYEYITAIQNELVAEDSCKEDIESYRKKVRKICRNKQLSLNRTLKVKSAMAIYCPFILKIYTAYRQKSVGNELERFL